MIETKSIENLLEGFPDMSLEKTINQEITIVSPGRYAHDEKSETMKLKIEIYNVNGTLVPVYNMKHVLTPEIYESVYSTENVEKELNSYEVFEKICEENESTLFTIKNNKPCKGVKDDINRFAKRLMDEKGLDWNNVARNWKNKGLLN